MFRAQIQAKRKGQWGGSFSISVPDNFMVLQDLLTQITETLNTETLVIQEKSCKLFDLLSSSSPARIALLINKGMCKLVK